MAKRKAARATVGRGRCCRHEHFSSALLQNERTLTVYLPPGYDEHADRRYPVVYMHDGQNLFASCATAPEKSWQADATADRLIQSGRLPGLLLVGMASTADRDDEYSCRRDTREKSGGRGELYGRFVFEEVKPFIDRTYRTLPERRHTGVAGSSLGGLISLEMARRHHDRFARCGALSPSLWWSRGQFLKDVATDQAWMRRMRLWVDIGTREGSRRGAVAPSVANARTLVGQFDEAGLVPGRNYYYAEVAGGEHHESAWAARFDKVLLFLFGW